MPGRKSYGPAGKWVHDRAKRIMREGDTKDQYGKKRGKSVAYAIAVQQAHKLGKSPKKFRTPTGVRVAKRKFDMPKKEYQKTAASMEDIKRYQRGATGAAVGIPVGALIAGLAKGGRRGKVLSRRAAAFGAVLGGAGGLAFGLHKPGKKQKKQIKKALRYASKQKAKGKKGYYMTPKDVEKRAMVSAFFDELEQIKLAQGPPEAATARGRAAASESAAQSVQNLATTGGIGEGQASGSGSTTPTGPSPTGTGGGGSANIGPATGPPAPAGGTRETGGGLDIPSANIGTVPGGGDPMAGRGGGLGNIPGGSPMGPGGTGMPGEMAPAPTTGGETSPSSPAGPGGGSLQNRIAKGAPGQLQ
jgi:hypothetical protein